MADEKTTSTAPVAPGSEKKLWVISGRADDRVAIWEPDPRHPGGELFVAGKAPAEAAMTPDVALHLRDGTLIEADAAAVAKRKAQLGIVETSTAKGPWD